MGEEESSNCEMSEIGESARLSGVDGEFDSVFLGCVEFRVGDDVELDCADRLW